MNNFLKKQAAIVVLLLTATTVAAQSRPSVSILGDSYSTFQGYIPEGNDIWYYSPIDPSRTDVAYVQQTWWWQVIKEGGYRLEKNESYSGSTVSFTGYNGEDYSKRSFITRLPRLGSPDIILIFGCINDSWAGVRVGEFKYDGITRPDLYTYRPALAYLLQQAQSHYPNVDIYYIIGDELREDITESTKEICRHYGITYIQLQGIDKKLGHPTIKGMRSIADQVLNTIGKYQQKKK